MRLVGMVWSVASVFAIPVMIRNSDPNPLGPLRKSAAPFKKTWGEALIGYIGTAFGSRQLLVGSLPNLLPLGGLAIWMLRPVLPILIGVAWLLGLMAISYLINLANEVFRCALCGYASEGVVLEPFTPAPVDSAWRIKKG